MQKNNDPIDPSTLLWYCIFHKNCGDRRQPHDFKVEEFGVSALDAFVADVLIKKIACESDDSGATEIYLCYNWKTATPFILIENRVQRKARTYTPQYGHEDNYPESVTWRTTTYQFYSQSEFFIHHPQIAKLLSAWIS